MKAIVAILSCLVLVFSGVSGTPAEDAAKDIVGIVENVTLETIEDIVLDLLDYYVPDSKMDLSLDGLSLNDIEAGIAGVDELLVPVLLRSQNDTLIEILITSAIQKFAIGLQGGHQDIDVGIFMNDPVMDVSLVSDHVPMNVVMTSDENPMDIKLEGQHMPLAVVANSAHFPMDIDVRSKDTTFDVTVKEIDVGSVPWVLIALVIVLQAISLGFVYYQSRTVASLEALIHSYSFTDGSLFCSSCGSRNGHQASYCQTCGQAMIRHEFVHHRIGASTTSRASSKSSRLAKM
eukprot:TRINITY_DN512_c0_g1::TRINITY_DN512_c0_g1_i1::g.10493::m.10493 TRINITY_DN512_c0_g1::TRINITY_DN512_c0_g1_i1::g.10493  ORF type:complete len:301 (-),score=70.83,DZR/PF12773.2/0.00037,zf-ribbon_3/PF13248.1/0.0049,Nudix_N_2/PF14803.1/15,Nudix_N_2/PF14803.1/4.1,zf-tcix/PF14952.1/1.2,zf-DHHC/PF01529.15/1.1e+03,zf-DHHC/PF01529.15/0.31,zf-NADH-PPase/PF09297.6/2.6e+03,zf-NADH-PPase/PF09297.6/4,zf-NADH-PPase/PF09297.6/28,zinc_ribbon_2/PF13240.1/1.6,zinc_ribbon_2/PF13240.1/6.3,Prim_Zn_Ribbon/PF08273.7/0.67,